ncbi:hypothetical protein UlMin_002744 [Ulmus minor]
MACFRTTITFLAIVFLSFSFSEAREILVGGQENSWTNPSSPSALNDWAAKTRFKVGDILVWKTKPNKESILEVTEENYNSCNRTNPIKKHKHEVTKIELDRSGLFYFISGEKGHCEKGQKLVVLVMSPNHNHDLVPAPAPEAPLQQSNRGAAGGLVVQFAAVIIASLVGMVVI